MHTTRSKQDEDLLTGPISLLIGHSRSKVQGTSLGVATALCVARLMSGEALSLAGWVWTGEMNAYDRVRQIECVRRDGQGCLLNLISCMH